MPVEVIAAAEVVDASTRERKMDKMGRFCPLEWPVKTMLPCCFELLNLIIKTIVIWESKILKSIYEIIKHLN